jgi:hypothetical protein
MAFSVTKEPDGDDVWSRKRLEHVQLQPAISDYQPGGYLLQGIGGTTESTGNVGLGKIAYVIPVGGEGGYKPVWNPATSKLQVFEDSAGTGPLVEVGGTTNLAAYTFNLLVVGTS